MQIGEHVAEGVLGVAPQRQALPATLHDPRWVTLGYDRLGDLVRRPVARPLAVADLAARATGLLVPLCSLPGPSGASFWSQAFRDQELPGGL